MVCFKERGGGSDIVLLVFNIMPVSLPPLHNVCPFVFVQPGSDSGTTAVVALIRGKQLIVANAGDSRCVVSERGRLGPIYTIMF